MWSDALQSADSEKLDRATKIDGNVEFWNGVQIGGWARDRTRTEAIRGECYYEGFLIADARADMFRENLRAVATDGRCAFELRIPSNVSSVYPARLEIRA